MPIEDYLDLPLRMLIKDLSDRPSLYAWRNEGQKYFRFAVRTKDKNRTAMFGFDDESLDKSRRAFERAVDALRAEIFAETTRSQL